MRGSVGAKAVTGHVGSCNVELRDASGNWIGVEFEDTTLVEDLEDPFLISIPALDRQIKMTWTSKQKLMTLGGIDLNIETRRNANGTKKFGLVARQPKGKCSVKLRPDDDAVVLKNMPATIRAVSSGGGATASANDARNARAERRRLMRDKAAKQHNEPPANRELQVSKPSAPAALPGSISRRESSADTGGDKESRTQQLNADALGLRGKAPLARIAKRIADKKSRPAQAGKRCKLVHRVVGHASLSMSQRLLMRSDTLADKQGRPRLRAKTEMCGTCSSAKMSCRNRSGRAAQIPSTGDKVLCADLLALAGYKAADGSRCELVLVDQHSLVLDVIGLPGKSAVEIRTGFERHLKQRGISLRGLTLWCDTDSSLAMSDDFVDWFESEGGAFRCSAPGDNFQNGQAETRIHDYKMRVKALLKERGAPDEARSWARDHAVVLLNNTPSRRHLTGEDYPFDMRTPNEVHGRETLDIARLPVWGSAAMVFVPNLSTHRGSGPRKHDMDGPSRSTWTADNSEPMIFVGVSRKHANDVFVFARNFGDNPKGPHVRTSRTYKIDNRRYRTLAHLQRARDGVPRVTRDMESDPESETSDSDHSEDDIDKQEERMAQLVTSAKEDQDLEGLFWVKLPYDANVEDMAELFAVDAVDMMQWLRCFAPFTGTTKERLISTVKPKYVAGTAVPHPRLSAHWWVAVQDQADQDDALDIVTRAAETTGRLAERRVRRTGMKSHKRLRRLPDPKTDKEALEDPVHGEHWSAARDDEMAKIQQKVKWDHIEKADIGSERVLNTKWVYKFKYARDGTIDRYRARLCVVGTGHVVGVHYGSGVAPTVRSSTFRYVLARAARKRHVVHGLDFTQAFMQSELEKPALIRMPHGYGGERGLVVRCGRALYGLKAAPKLFYNFATDLFRSLGFVLCPSDACLLRRARDNLVIAMHVDDVTCTCPSTEVFDNLVEEMRAAGAEFTIDKELTKAMGIDIDHGVDRAIRISQGSYIRANILERFGFDNIKPSVTPFRKKTYHAPAVSEQHPVHELLGAVNWCSTQTRPDITYAVHRCAKLVSKPAFHFELWERLKQIVAYLAGTLNDGITFRAGDRDNWDRVTVFADSNFAAAYESRRSTTGLVVAYNGSPILWSTKLQSCASMANETVSILPAQSTGEAELNALQSGTKEAIGMRALQLFVDDYVPDSEPTWRGPIPVWARKEVASFAEHPEAAADGGPNVAVATDSNAAIGTASNPPNSKARHHSLCSNFVRDALAFRFINLKHVATDNQFADIFTKAPTAPMLRLLKSLMDGAAKLPLLARLYM